MNSNDPDRQAARPASPEEWRETEFRSPRFQDLEKWKTGEILDALLGGQISALNAVWGGKAQIERAVAKAVERLSETEGRIVYVGAGTSGRLAVLDGIELTPTFGWPSERLVYLFAGGDAGLQHAVEGAEDDEVKARASIANAKVGSDDVVLALAASGTTPYTRAAVKAARERGALTISFANNPGSPLLGDAEIGILLHTGAEVLAGSTRLAAGTSQKIALNLFSTALMIGLHKIYQGFMVDMQLKNEKLVLRAQAMLMAITGCSNETARKALQDADKHIKLAVLIVQGAQKGHGQQLLLRHKGDLGSALAELNANPPQS